MEAAPLQESGKKGIDRLRVLLSIVPRLLGNIRAETAAKKTAAKTWSAKEELGHLLDSACNNHQRIVRTQLEDRPAMPGYNGDDWVVLSCYQEREWSELIAIWSALNQQLLTAADAVQGSDWSRSCTIGDSGPLTLSFILNDYLAHMIHHLRHIGLKLDGAIESASDTAASAI